MIAALVAIFLIGPVAACYAIRSIAFKLTVIPLANIALVMFLASFSYRNTAKLFMISATSVFFFLNAPFSGAPPFTELTYKKLLHGPSCIPVRHRLSIDVKIPKFGNDETWGCLGIRDGDSWRLLFTFTPLGFCECVGILKGTEGPQG